MNGKLKEAGFGDIYAISGLAGMSLVTVTGLHDPLIGLSLFGTFSAVIHLRM